MDSLLATYASSDEEDDNPNPQPPQPQQPFPPKPSLSLFSSLPKPQSSSSSSSSSAPPQIKQHKLQDPSKPSALFSLLPPPKSQPTPEIPLPIPTLKRVVQFRPPLPTPPNFIEDDEEDEDDEEERERKKQRQPSQDVSVKSFLSTMPTPKNSGHSSLGAGPPSLGSGRRSTIDTEGLTSVPTSFEVIGMNSEVGSGSNLVGAANNYSYEVGDQGQGNASYGGYGDNYGSSSDYGGYDSSNWYNGAEGGSTTAVGGGVVSFASLGGGKRRKDQPPAEIIEVKQDELMRNRPTEDKSKLTGIAFGPAYQPASTKGKPTKQHKRKHQIGSLYFDMKQKEMELAERRSKGFLTKAETQAKYGW